MEDKEGFLFGFLTILGAGLFSVLFSTLLWLLVGKFLENFSRNFSKKVSTDVEKQSLESWKNKDS
jgi:hypothetical protein